ncbi:MAG: endolytic transglycosylase MltG [Oscillospiraceae bacterium]
MEQERKKTAGNGGERRPPVKRRRRKQRGLTSAAIYVLFVIGTSVLLAAVGWVCANDVLALNKPEHSAVITVTEGEKFSKVVDSLKKEDLIEYKWLFNLFSAVTGAKDDIAPGSYSLTSEMDYRAIVTNLSASSSTRQVVDVTIPEGLTLKQTFELLEKKGVSTVDKLNDMAATHDYKFDFLADIPMGDPSRLEGYLFPDTYTFYAGENPLYAINKMLVNFDAKLTAELRQQVKDSGYTIHQIVNIASMIEKETDGTDQTKIASVIYNRMKNLSGGTNGYLQIDATVQYALPVRKEHLSIEDTQIDSPYNTYKYTGLPAGPIANPGISSIRAALNPKNTSYYYYVLGNDGTHSFFTTLRGQQDFIAQQAAAKPAA